MKIEINEFLRIERDQHGWTLIKKIPSKSSDAKKPFKEKRWFYAKLESACTTALMENLSDREVTHLSDVAHEVRRSREAVIKAVQEALPF